MQSHRTKPRLSLQLLLVLAALLTCVGAAWRFTNLGGDSFWLDEMITLRDTRAGLDAMYSEVNHPPLLHVVTYYTTRLLGEDEFAIRFPMALAGVLAIPLMVFLGAALRRPGAGLWSALLLALLPFHLRYSQEARNYAFLMTFSLASYALLATAMTRRRVFWWLAFGLITALNLYTHYAALVVLLWEAILITGWLVRQLAHRQFSSLLGPAVAAIMVFVLYLPWLPRMLVGFNVNTGTDALGAFATSVAPAVDWMREVYRAFGFDAGILPMLTTALCGAGMVVLLHERDWLALSLIGLGLVVPILSIEVFAVFRAPLPKYVIYLLPLYLMSAGIALDAFIRLIRSHMANRGDTTSAAIGAILAALVVIVTWPLLDREHAYIEEDWKGITQYLGRVAKENDVFVSMALDLPNGYNQGGVVWPHYLQKAFKDYRFLATNQLMPEQAEWLADTNADIWMVLLDRSTPAIFEDGTAEVIPFQNSHFLVHPLSPARNDLEKMIAMYKQMIPLAVAPSPQCMLRQDLAAMYVVAEDFAAAEQMAAEAGAQCASGELADQIRYPLLSRIYQGLLKEYRASGQTEQLHRTEEAARNTALKLVQLGIRDAVAMDLLTVNNLGSMFTAGEAQVSDASSPVPVQVERYAMPQDGDWSDALLIHAGASVSFPITLPKEPTVLSFRAAMDPNSWDWGGDGSTFVVRVEMAGAEPTEVFRLHITDNADDRHWHGEMVPLTPYAGQPITITLATEPGPALDYTGDMAAWGEPRVILTR